MRPRSLLGPVRIVLVVAGLLVVAGAVRELAAIPEPPPGSHAPPVGIVVGFLLLAGTAGLALAAGGLAIPAPAGSPGGGLLRFGRGQRRLVVAGLVLLVCGLAGSVAVLFLANAITAALGLWFALTGLGVVAVVAALCWRLVEFVTALADGL